jgi:hypothetical protein
MNRIFWDAEHQTYVVEYADGWQFAVKADTEQQAQIQVEAWDSEELLQEE